MTWPVLPLGAVADTALGKMLDKGRTKGHAHVQYLRNINVQWGRIDTHDLLTMELAAEERDRFAVQAGDLLVCEGGEVGRCAIWPGRCEYIAFQKALHRVRPGAGLESRYLRYLFEHHAQSGALADLSTGSTIAHLPQQQLRRVPVPLPPLDEQRHIVDLLEDHLSRLDAATSYLSLASSRSQVLHEQLLTSALTEVDTHESPLADLLVAPLTNGRSVPTQEGGFPVLRLTALRGDRIELSERKAGAWARADAERHLVQRGDFLISRGNGSLHLVGRGGLVDQDPDPVAYPDTLIRARPNESQVSAEYLSLAWNSVPVRRQIETVARTTAGIYKVNQKDLGGIRVPVPSLDRQADIVSQVNDQRSALGRLDIERQCTIERAIGLRRSLLAAAFSG